MQHKDPVGELKSLNSSSSSAYICRSVALNCWASTEPHNLNLSGNKCLMLQRFVMQDATTRW